MNGELALAITLENGLHNLGMQGLSEDDLPRFLVEGSAAIAERRGNRDIVCTQ